MPITATANTPLNGGAEEMLQALNMLNANRQSVIASLIMII